MSNKTKSNSKKMKIGVITVKVENRGKKKNCYNIHIEHEDLPAFPFTFMHFTEQLIDLFIKEALAQRKYQQIKISSLDITKILQSAFILFKSPQAKRPIGWKLCKDTIQNKMNELIGILRK